ncbi:MAG: hypothetical protein JW776_06055 [Candidatus Lokiarchaeota archaeon]|nr:hypothetical protein [Candidatus Lokiarchaeota archaeon]
MTGIFLYYRKNHTKWPKNIRKIANKLKHRGDEHVETVQNSEFFGKFFINYAQRENYKQFHTNITRNGHLLFEVVDGSIYNKSSLLKMTGKNSPQMLLLDAFNKHGINVFKEIKGIYAILLKSNSEIILAKDPIGNKPLYILNTVSAFVVASELKALSGFSGTPIFLEPGTVCVYNFITDEITYTNFFDPERLLEKPSSQKIEVGNIKQQLYSLVEKAVRHSINVPCKVGALLSGGIDSTVICALTQKFIPDLDIYTVVTKNSPDLPHALNFAKMYPNTNHHIFNVTLSELLEIVPEVIYHLETFDAALIRSALPMYYVSSKVDEETGVLLTGEGGDELFGGYEYLKNLSTSQLKLEMVQMLKIEHATGLQRVDRIPYAFSLEARAPWFDSSLINFSFSLPLDLKLRKREDSTIEKWIIRESFKELIPESVYLRKKAKFSKGVGSQFFLRDYFNQKISDEEFKNHREIYPSIFVKNKEELYYWQIFSSLFQPEQDFVENLPRTGVWTY